MKIPVVFIRTLVAGLSASLITQAAFASSHREAPGITRMPQVDGTDFYLFRSYEPGRDTHVTLIANYHPLQDPFGGPNYFPLDPDAAYDIRITNDGDTIEDITYRFKYTQTTPAISLTIGGVSTLVPLANLGTQPNDVDNYTRSITVQQITGPLGTPSGDNFITNASDGSSTFAIPFDNIGDKSFPNGGYAVYASRFVYTINIPNCPNSGRLFVGPREESFTVNLGETFDLVNLNPLGSEKSARSSTQGKNITTLALEIPIDCLTVADGSDVIAAWTTASLPRNRALSNNPTFGAPDTQSGDLVQVSRLANPLVNEIVIGLPDKNLFNASEPLNDGTNFLSYVTNPSFPAIIEILFQVRAPTNFPRDDLVAVFLTGLDGVNSDGSVGELMRLNTTTPPTPRDEQNNMGVIAGDNAGYPNGRRLGDDSVDISLRVVMGRLCHLGLGLCAPEDALDGMLDYTDQTYQGADQFTNAFPYLKTPISGSPNMRRVFSAKLGSDQEVPPVASAATGSCDSVLNAAGTQLAIQCEHTVVGATAAHIHLAEEGVNGDIVCDFGPATSPIALLCPVDQAFLEAVQMGMSYVNIHTAANPGGEIRGQLR